VISFAWVKYIISGQVVLTVLSIFRTNFLELSDFRTLTVTSGQSSD